jgi:succinoglycan biosynthesis protein ExoM
MTEKKHISVCICTYKRPELLRRLLSKLGNQETGGLFDYSIIIVDNDRSESARKITELWNRDAKIQSSYYVEPEQNIALARNKAAMNAKGDFIAFIDDDEFPTDDWLQNLFKTFYEFRADGVLGPVKPYFETEPPDWIVKGKLCERESFKTGTIIRDGRYTRTGNVLLSKNIFDDKEGFFNPLFGKTGGEDGDFFRRMIQKGRLFVWCDEGWVSEIVPPERFKRSYFLKRALLQGSAFANSKNISFRSLEAFRSVVAFVLYTSGLPVLLLIRHDLFMRYLIKDCYHLAMLFALCGLKIVKERTF